MHFYFICVSQQNCTWSQVAKIWKKLSLFESLININAFAHCKESFMIYRTRQDFKWDTSQPVIAYVKSYHNFRVERRLWIVIGKTGQTKWGFTLHKAQKTIKIFYRLDILKKITKTIKAGPTSFSSILFFKPATSRNSWLQKIIAKLNEDNV